MIHFYPFLLCQHRKPKLRVFKFHYGEAEIARPIELRRCKSNVGWKRISPVACTFWIFLIRVQMWILQQSRFVELELNLGWSSTFGWGESSTFVGETMTWPWLKHAPSTFHFLEQNAFAQKCEQYFSRCSWDYSSELIFVMTIYKYIKCIISIRSTGWAPQL